MCKLFVRAASSNYMFHCHVRFCGAITLNNISSGPSRFPVLRGSLVVCALTKDIFMDLMRVTHMLTAGITIGFMFRYLTGCVSHLEETCYRFSSMQLSLLANVPWTS
jgi:hypothetical protein